MTTNAVTIARGRCGSRSALARHMDKRALENFDQIYDMMFNKALSEGDVDAGKFILNKVWTDAKPGKTIDIELPDMKTIEDIIKVQESIMIHIKEGNITPDVGSKLFDMTELARKTFDTEFILNQLAEMQEKVKQAGL